MKVKLENEMWFYSYHCNLSITVDWKKDNKVILVCDRSRFCQSRDVLG